jgi:hypothetical protein
VDFIESGQLIVSWKEHKAFLKEEASEERIQKYNDDYGYRDRNKPVITALEQVFQSAADGVDFTKGGLIGAPESIARLKTRARIDPEKQSPVAHTDRQGKLHLPFDEAFELGRKFCTEEPSTVLVDVEATERDWSHKATHGEDYIVELLNEYRASWAPRFRQSPGCTTRRTEGELLSSRPQRLGIART